MYDNLSVIKLITFILILPGIPILVYVPTRIYNFTYIISYSNTFYNGTIFRTCLSFYEIDIKFD